MHDPVERGQIIFHERHAQTARMFSDDGLVNRCTIYLTFLGPRDIQTSGASPEVRTYAAYRIRRLWNNGREEGKIDDINMQIARVM